MGMIRVGVHGVEVSGVEVSGVEVRGVGGCGVEVSGVGVSGVGVRGMGVRGAHLVILFAMQILSNTILIAASSFGLRISPREQPDGVFSRALHLELAERRLRAAALFTTTSHPSPLLASFTLLPFGMLLSCRHHADWAR